MKRLDPYLTSSYDFNLPKELIATKPANPRDSAKLLVYNRQTDVITHSYFYNLDKFLPNDCAIIFNNTKVIKARLFGVKESGAKIELLINKPIDAYTINVYIKGKVTPFKKILFSHDLVAQITKLNNDGSRCVIFLHKNKKIRFEELLKIIDKIGHVPLPPYIARKDNKQDIDDYQSVFAMQEGAIAAPTASLHFTQKQYEDICKKYKHAFVTLHVGAGTFKPVQTKLILKHPMHSEYYNISDEALNIIHSNEPILSIGTTSTRTIEYFVQFNAKQNAQANLFLHPNNKPQRVNHLLTNFHLPQSTLIMLVASFIGLEKTLQLYKEAIKNSYRFYSYGDAMLIL